MGSQPGKRSGGHKVIVASECQPPARPGGRGSWGCHQGGCPRSGMGSEGIQDSSGYLPEVLTVVADTAGTACPPGIQPCQSDQPRVQLVAHSWAETTPVGSQHLWAPRASGPENGTCVSGIAMRTAPPYTHTPYNPAITRAQVHQFSGTTSKQQQHVLHLPHTRPNIGYLPKKRNGAGRARVH